MAGDSSSDDIYILDGYQSFYGGSDPLLAHDKMELSFDVFDRPSEQLSLSWENIDVVSVAEKKCIPWRQKNTESCNKYIIKTAYGIVKPGELLGIIGTVGSGKTTLLNTLSGRNLGHLKVSGNVLINGIPLDCNHLSKVSGYVQQRDSFIWTMKVREHLMFQAQMKLGNEFSNEQRQERVNDVMEQLGLTHRANTIIGGQKRKTLSGGEKRRLLLAGEILTNPPILFCDEPTTGLDSFMAENVIEILKNLAASGRGVICTIHQPASEVYQLFDKIMIISNGYIVSFGTKQEVLSTFEMAGFTCPDNYNPANFIVRCISKANDGRERGIDNVQKIINEYEESDIYEDVLESIKTEKKSGKTQESRDILNSFNIDLTKKTKEIYVRSNWNQFKYLAHRCCLQQLRDPIGLRFCIIQVLLMGVFSGILFFKTPYNQTGVNNINSALFLMQLMCAYNSMLAVMTILPQEFTVFMREYKDHMYSMHIYYLAHLVVEIPVYVAFPPVVLVSIIYYMIGLYPTLYCYSQLLLILFLVSLYGIAVAHATSTATVSLEMNLTILPFLRTTFMIFGGYFISSSSIPLILAPLKYISVFHYSYELAVINQWINVDEIDCEESMNRCLNDGKSVIRSLDFSLNDYHCDFISISLLYIVIEIGGFLFLFIRTKMSK